MHVTPTNPAPAAAAVDYDTEIIDLDDEVLPGDEDDYSHVAAKA